jgi:sugar phosphate isomerase/epimerase
MKFAICNETFRDWPFETAFAFAAECGYTGLEMAPFTISDYVTDISSHERAEVRRQAHQAGLEIVGLHWLLAKTEGFHLTSPDAEVRRKTAEYLGELARFCADLGGKVMVFGSPQQRNLLPGVSHDDAMEHAAGVLTAALPVLEETEVTLALEPLAPAETDFMQKAAEAVALAERVASPQVRVHLDCKAMSSESVPIPDLIRQHRSLLAHFHANDPNLQGPGFGALDFLPILGALGEIDYRGWVSVEVFDYTPGIERLARESIEHMLACLGRLAK